MRLKMPEPRFISEEDGNPTYGIIADVKEDEKGGVMLYLETKDGCRRASLWGDNLAKAIKSYGDDSAAWAKKSCSCAFEQSAVDGKKYRIFTFT